MDYLKQAEKENKEEMDRAKVCLIKEILRLKKSLENEIINGQKRSVVLAGLINSINEGTKKVVIAQGDYGRGENKYASADVDKGQENERIHVKL